MALIRFLETHLLPCPIKALLHIGCPGCGLQRSILRLAQGDLHGSLALHPAAIPILVLIIFTLLHLLFRFSKGAKIIIALQLLVAVVSLTFYIYKIAKIY